MRFQQLDDWLAWQSTLHPEEIELGLERVVTVWRKLRPKGLSCKVITVAGTNGKGSCVAMLEAIYLHANYTVGTYTSPHLERYNERIHINGQTVSDERLCQVFERVDQARHGVMLTYFEFGTLAALDIFANAPLDLVILEVGLGGRLDAVNIIDPDVSLITTVDLDHMDWLGATKEKIGAEKAGIMRSNRPAVLAQVDMPDSVHRHAEALGVDVYQFGKDFHIEPALAGFSWFSGKQQYVNLLKPGLLGQYQLQNAAAALMVCECLSQQLPVDRESISKALGALQLPGRMQILPGTPLVILDVGHNSQAVKALRDNLAGLSISGKLHAIFGILSGKDLASISGILAPKVASWHLVDTEGPRGQSAEQLKSSLIKLGVDRKIFCCGAVKEALTSAKAQVCMKDAILVFGSFQVVGGFLEHLNKRGCD